MADDSKPTPKEAASMRKQREDMQKDADNAKGAKSGSTTLKDIGVPLAKGGSIRGGGCETKGKTKGRMV